MKRIFYGTAVLALVCGNLFAQKTYIQAGKLIDVRNNKTLSEMTIVVEGEMIVSVAKGYQKGTDEDQIIDLKSATVMPGLMDMHIHVEGQTGPRQYMERFTNNEADVAFNSLVYAKTTLMAGFTTVRDMGGSGVNISLRDAIAAGKVDGPRIITAGKSIAPTGGHADPTNGVRRDLMGDPGPEVGVINGVADARKAVRQQVKNGSDVIKITATGGVLSVAKDGSAPQFQQDELNAVIETARDFGIHVAAHAHGDEGMQRSVIGGIHSIEHGTLMSEKTMDMMIKAGTWYVPTITAGMSVAEYARIPGYYPAPVKAKAEAIGAQIQTTFGKAYKRGVKIAFGTDAGVFPHGENYREFIYMTEVGMPNLEAIQTATLRGAELLGMENKIGVLESGKFADIIAVSGDPEKDIKVMKDVVFVMKEGKVYKHVPSMGMN
ncbi:amidohydrolase [Rhodonellum psychrophilum GCM71 = DSM 17998]|uniref:Amidohydrolase n=2 Tax=Rhodonellum TaxID=336827 RepID=U5C297_9BACT|nr:MULTISPECIES: amidohydrolase family protein [Rhodonellum]ERM83914.1 amidohydrolase [Rhodonellum psychrophilum GCM71 = DSM 17998]MDO9550900.1 amidohydrolase family protein [Rhodonellum sp.]SDZ04878.1 Imidazolonepropionase [Rhodonellum ikkaensis]